MTKIPESLHKEIDECNEMELHRAQTYLLFRIHGILKFFYTMWWLGIGLTVLGYFLFLDVS